MDLHQSRSHIFSSHVGPGGQVEDDLFGIVLPFSRYFDPLILLHPRRRTLCKLWVR